MNVDRENIRLALLPTGGGIKREGDKYFAGVHMGTGPLATEQRTLIHWRSINDGIVDHMIAEGSLDPANIRVVDVEPGT